jgi:hypothetical protein
MGGERSRPSGRVPAIPVGSASDECGSSRRRRDVGLSVSIVVPAYNEQDYLPACLDALERNVAGRVVEIIVVDNASTDATREIVAARAGVLYAFEPDKGITRARQRDMRRRRGTSSPTSTPTPGRRPAGSSA